MPAEAALGSPAMPFAAPPPAFEPRPAPAARPPLPPLADPGPGVDEQPQASSPKAAHAAKERREGLRTISSPCHRLESMTSGHWRPSLLILGAKISPTRRAQTTPECEQSAV